MSWHELISDIAIIPAWECYLAGFITAALLCFGLWLWERRRRRK